MEPEPAAAGRSSPDWAGTCPWPLEHPLAGMTYDFERKCWREATVPAGESASAEGWRARAAALAAGIPMAETEPAPPEVLAGAAGAAGPAATGGGALLPSGRHAATQPAARHHPRPAGRARKGMLWDHAEGLWKPDPDAPPPPEKPEKPAARPAAAALPPVRPPTPLSAYLRWPRWLRALSVGQGKRQPPGRPPKGLRWNREIGEWEPDPAKQQPPPQQPQPQPQPQVAVAPPVKAGGFVPQPRGRPRSGHSWNFSLGRWEPDATGAPSTAPARKPPKQKTAEGVPQPRGRPKQGHTWNRQVGRWEKDEPHLLHVQQASGGGPERERGGGAQGGAQTVGSRAPAQAAPGAGGSGRGASLGCRDCADRGMLCLCVVTDVPQPRGRPKQGHSWNRQRGRWEIDEPKDAEPAAAALATSAAAGVGSPAAAGSDRDGVPGSSRPSKRPRQPGADTLRPSSPPRAPASDPGRSAASAIGAAAKAARAVATKRAAAKTAIGAAARAMGRSSARGGGR